MAASAVPYRLGVFAGLGAAPVLALLLEGRVVPIAQAAQTLGEPLIVDSMATLLEGWDEHEPLLRGLAERLAQGDGGLLYQARGVEMVQPVIPVAPRQIFMAGANYRKHVMDLVVDSGAFRDKNLSVDQQRAEAGAMLDNRAKTGRPFVFQGLYSALASPGDPLVLPYDVAQPDWELELAVVIGRAGRRIPRDTALDHVAAYTVANDVTARDKVARKDAGPMGMDWLASKNAPGFLPVGPYLTPAAFVPDPQDLQVTLKLNGDVMQDESTADMLFGVARIIEFISAHVQLLPGDLICTGSPSGNGTHYDRFLRDGDVMEGEITGLGVLRTPCVAEVASSTTLQA
jgi:2,4-diketo-3-deoxy-L-fuconate hydrolase